MRSRRRRFRSIKWAGISLGLAGATLLAITMHWYICLWMRDAHFHSFPGGFYLILPHAKVSGRGVLQVWQHYKDFHPHSLLGRPDAQSQSWLSGTTLRSLPAGTFVVQSPSGSVVVRSPSGSIVIRDVDGKIVATASGPAGAITPRAITWTMPAPPAAPAAPRVRSFTLPIWPVLPVAAVMTWLPGWLYRRRVRRRRTRGLCRGCGYNLRGNVSGICPECGRPCKRIAAA